MLAFVIFIVVVALIFDFLNGMNDAANSIATVVSTRVLSPRLAVLWAAFFNLAAAFFFGVHVATTIGKGVVDPGIVDATLILSTLCAAIFWTYTCTYIGLPISVSHALVGGLVGSGIAKAGLKALIWSGLLKIAVFIVIAPLLGTILGYLCMVAVYWICRRGTPQRIDRWFRRLQLISAGAYSLGHGTNDAQKTMGIITVLLYSTGYLKGEFHVPFWVVIICHVAIALGTLAGGWRVIETLGMKMTKLKPVHGFCAETAAASSILLATVGGIPVSTTHTITGAIIGVGATTKLSAVRWGVAANIVLAWLLTIPTTAVIAGILYSVFSVIEAI
ncbi:MAG: inorganic phosphate transporter [Desulfobacterales bacterium]|nr:MAG: inorganic phosphate transporter [Desulfobacterales bacterium]